MAEVSGQCGVEGDFSFLIWKNTSINRNDPVKGKINDARGKEESR